MKLNAAPADMTRGKPAGLLLRFAIPLLIGNLFQQFYNVVDSLIVGNYVGTQALAAVGIGDYPLRVMLALFIGLGTGASIRISQSVGAGDVQTVRKTIRTVNILLVVISVPLTIIGLFITRPVLGLMNTPADAMPDAVSYLSVMFIGVIGLLGYNLNAGILRGLGDSRSSLIFLIIATFVNIGLDMLFVAVFKMGVTGAAIATIVAMAVSWLCSILYIAKRYPHYHAGFWPLKVDKDSLKSILRLGLPIGINDALFSLGHLTLSSLINTHGSAFAAGYNVGTKVDSLAFMPIASMSASTTTYVGQNVGAKTYERIKPGTRAALLMTIGWNVFFCALILIFGHLVIGLFDSNPAVIEAGYAYILRLEPFYWIYAIMFILNAVMNGAGEVRVPMIANLVLFWVVRLPVAYLISRFLPPNNIFFCFPISWLAGTLVSGLYYLSGRWKKRLAPREESALEQV